MVKVEYKWIFLATVYAWMDCKIIKYLLYMFSFYSIISNLYILPMHFSVLFIPFVLYNLRTNLTVRR
jgi:hypothetical protein